jgi:hypothetical protein
MHASKHLSRWLLILGGLIVLYYMYKSVMAVFEAAASTITAPIRGIEGVATAIGTGISNGAKAIYNDVTGFAASLTGGNTLDTSMQPPDVIVYPTLGQSLFGSAANPTAGSTSTTATGTSNNAGSTDGRLDFSVLDPSSPNFIPPGNFNPFI